MTATVITKTMRSGRKLLYIQISYKNFTLNKWQTKHIATGLPEKGNKKKAAEMIPAVMKKYSYLEQKQEDVISGVDHNISLSEYIGIWLKRKKEELDENTFESYEYRVNRIVSYFEPYNLKLIDVSSRHIDQYLRYELAYGKIDQKTKEKGPLSVRTVRGRKSILSAVFDQACIDGLVNHNPVTSVKVSGKKNRDYEEELLFLTEEEVTELLEFLSENYPRLMPIGFVAAYYGLRRSELLGLTWSAIDFDKRLITIGKTVVRNKNIHIKSSVKTKNSKRELYLFDNALECFRYLEKEQKEYREFFGNSYHETGYVFTKEDGSLYDPDLLSKHFAKATAEFGRPEITLHKLRHSCASIASNRGWSIKQVQYWLGHSDIQTTMNIYTHYSKKKLNSTNSDMNLASEGAVKLFGL